MRMHVERRAPVAAPQARRTREGGFTLIEVLLAIGVTSFVMLAVGTTFSVTLEARYVIEELAESTAAGPRILGLIERDLRGLWTYNVADNRVLVGRSGDVGSFEADRINVLTTTDAIGYVLDNHNQPVHPTLCEVGYWLKPNPRYRDLIELWRREEPMIDDDLQTGGRFQLVHDRIKSFKISYYEHLGYESEELHEWDSATADLLPRRIKIEFTLERKRGSRNVVSDAEVEDFEGAEKTYVRHIVLDRRLGDVLRANTALIPVRPGPPEAETTGTEGAGGPLAAGEGGAGAGAGGAGGRQPFGLGPGAGRGQPTDGRGESGRQTEAPRGIPQGGQPPPGGPALPPGFDIREILGGGRGGSGGFGGLFGR